MRARSTYEELAFRSYFIINLVEGIAGWRGTSRPRALWWAIGLAAVGWGLYHAVLDNATVVSTAVIVGYGVAFGTACVACPPARIAPISLCSPATAFGHRVHVDVACRETISRL